MPDAPTAAVDYTRRHLRFGWWSLLVFLTLGFTLELLHGFKVGMYLDASNETRRLMWTLAHAHGSLLGLIHVLFGLSLRGRVGDRRRQRPPDLAESDRCQSVAPRRVLPWGGGLLQR